MNRIPTFTTLARERAEFFADGMQLELGPRLRGDERKERKAFRASVRAFPFLFAVIAGLCGAGAAFAQSESPPAGPFCQAAATGDLPRPALSGEQFADPFVYCAGGRFYVVATNWAGVHIPIARSDDLSAWAVLRDPAGKPLDAMPDLPGWAVRGRGVRPDIWAPEVAHLNGRWVLFFSARHGSAKTPVGSPRECIGAAVADRPEGPFKPQPQPLVCGGFAEGVIDASYLQDGERGWLYFKSDGNCCHLPATLYVAPLTRDGLHLSGAINPVNVSNDREWEGEIVEAPSMVKHGDRYVLFYSGGLYFTPAYGVAYAQCAGPAGPCWKPEQNRLLQSWGRLDGPGHQSVFDVGGQSYIAFHALGAGGGQGVDRLRELHVEPLSWDGDTPTLAALCSLYAATDTTGVQAACPWAPLPAK